MQLFEKIQTDRPGLAEEKLVPVLGDLAQIKLGLSDGDYDTLTEAVSVVFHVAATVRFDEPLRDAILKNVRGTREVVRMAKRMDALKVGGFFVFSFLSPPATLHETFPKRHEKQQCV